MVTQGSVQIKLACPQSIKYLYPEYDYENFEFKSPVNVWNPQSKYSPDFDKIKFLEFTLVPGKTFYLPAYWWHSIKFNDINTTVSVFNYRTYMNNVAISPYFALHALQLLNVKRNITKINNQSTVDLNIEPDKKAAVIPDPGLPTNNNLGANNTVVATDTSVNNNLGAPNTNIDTTNIDTINIDSTTPIVQKSDI